VTYEALARKWRPQTFEDVVEQPQVTQTLKNAITAGRIHHAYLLCGPRGTGKTTTARILAKALNCEQGPSPVPCNKCATCAAITNGNSLDVLEIDAASNTGVDNIRDLRESARYVPVSSRYKIYIIDEVHRLSPQAFDALLKTLEEPPPSVIFMMATTEPNEVPATVRSRTLRFDFHLVSHRGLRETLGRIAAAESIDIDDGALDLIATEASGSLRDGQSLLDQLVGYAGGKLTTELAHEALGLVDVTVLFDLTDAFAGHDPARSLEVIAQVSQSGRDLQQLLKQVTEHLKRLLFAHSLGSRFADESLNQDTLARYAAAARSFEESDLLRLLKMVIELGNRYKKAAQPRLEVELLVMRCARMDRSIDIRQVLDRLEGGTVPLSLFEHGTGSSAPVAERAPAPQAVRGSAPTVIEPPRDAPPAKASLPSAAQRSPVEMQPSPNHGPAVAISDDPPPSGAPGVPLDFEPILEAICRARATLRAILGHAELIRTGPGTVDLNVYNGSPFHQQQLKQKPIRDLIHAEIARVLGAGIRVTIHVKDSSKSRTGIASTSPGPSAAAVASGDLVRSDHNLQEILRRFDGEIVG
jgi:DNA polymerase-3 subunit gamma/tau